MAEHHFTLIASGLSPEDDDFEEGLFAAGCDDATISVSRGRVVLDFAREEKNFIQALASAVESAEAAGARIERIEPDPLVSASDIARRTNLTRAAISNYAKGMRLGNFPPFPSPLARVSSDNPLWDWGDVAGWLRRCHKLSDPDASVEARIISLANRALLIIPRSDPQSLRCALISVAKDERRRSSVAA
ncbi:hypothetical protein [Afifella marina]|uniref:Transcriptional regulator, AlpA family n=1 Tax=Afifella marina DSM 2698 TaxID=1120955 RepID=A0A1G5NCB7_AFIMA|nr:hypothetical protein [Afifella marina]SCZ34270.1 hypothetical protein SAMN03080610_01663 [Afifella marina DSM 2698]